MQFDRAMISKRYRMIFKTTSYSLVASVSITALIQIFFGDDAVPTAIGLTISTIVPLCVAPLASYAYIRLLERISMMEEEQRRLASVDGLTNIANRRVFDETLSREWDIAIRRGTPIAVFLFDVDYFKRYNDHYGHPAGDECLKAIADLLRSKITRKTDLLARYGGEEFVVVFPDTSEDDVFRLAESIGRAIEELKIEHIKSDVSSFVTISGGIAVLQPDEQSTPGRLTKGADEALYESKKSGRNRVTVLRHDQKSE